MSLRRPAVPGFGALGRDLIENRFGGGVRVVAAAGVVGLRTAATNATPVGHEQAAEGARVGAAAGRAPSPGFVAAVPNRSIRDIGGLDRSGSCAGGAGRGRVAGSVAGGLGRIQKWC
ncbi:hypothetical protein Val02_34700 [Virgisporangium aliadipatigenens]|uniref:Uncharacterized protein n=1 Tax=Virgisporangium aliadipatigenens TaxID=741659 RepID=A0A8J4DQG3_9ACTN|nr:hypothetical protein Val02_34700 [Virgisporangium aliadipatigenens]